MGDFLAAFTVKELTFAGLFFGLLVVTVVPLFRGGLIPLRHHREVVNMLEKRVSVEEAAKNDALAANKELLKQNTLLLMRDDVAISAMAQIRDLVHRHDEEPTS